MNLKFIFIAFLSLLLVPAVFAIRINEIELNPIEGNEWIELYNDGDQEVNLSNWEIWDGLSSPKKIYTIPSETILNKGEYYFAELNNARTLNNNGDFVTLYNGNGDKIDETEELKEIKTSTKTWQFCEGWAFIESTKEQENSCSQEPPPGPEPPEENSSPTSNNASNNTTNNLDEDETKGDENTNEEEDKINFNKEIINTPLGTINLNAEVIDENKDTKTLNKKNNSAYYLISFCLLLGLLILLKMKKKPKNEFR